jgi:hypothetical protein
MRRKSATTYSLLEGAVLRVDLCPRLLAGAGLGFPTDVAGGAFSATGFTAASLTTGALTGAAGFAAAAFLLLLLIHGATILVTLLFNSLDNSASDFFCFLG